MPRTGRMLRAETLPYDPWKRLHPGLYVCNVTKGTTQSVDKVVLHVAKAVKALGLKHTVITSVTRDDLSDGGAGHFVAVVEAIRKETPVAIEVLIPDFQGMPRHLKR